MTELERNILLCCAGKVVSLPYDATQRAAEARLERLGLISRGYEDDQPTTWITDAGRAVLA